MLRINKDGVSERAHVDAGNNIDEMMSAPYEPWRKEDIEKAFQEVLQGADKGNDKKTFVPSGIGTDGMNKCVEEHLMIGKRYLKQAVNHQMALDNVLHQEMDSSS